MAAAAMAAECPGNPDAIGTSRELKIEAKDYPRLGKMQYRASLPLADREVVLTFDDGPIPPYTTRVLTTLAANCVKATFFLVGRHTAAHPNVARLIYELGHTVGNHSQNHSLHFHALGSERERRELDNGLRSIKAALGEAAAVSPFFRIPGLNRTSAIETYAQKNAMSVWSSDTLADDWTHISAKEVMRRALSRLEAKGRGILLLHDIQPRTALMLPELLAELKRRKFKIVHVVPEGDVPHHQFSPDDLIAIAEIGEPASGWPRVVSKPERPLQTATVGEQESSETP